MAATDMEIRPSRLVSRSTALFTRWLIRRRFHSVWVREAYRPEPTRSTLYFLNHSRWWDGLLPLLLNEFRFRQDPRAMMDRKQWERYPFFRKIGAFPVDNESSRAAIPALRFAADWISEPGHALYLYPEGRFYPSHLRERRFQPGLQWISRQSEHLDLVPVGVVTQHYRASRPDLFLNIGPRIDPGADLPNTLKRSLEELDRLSDSESLESLKASFELWIGRS